MTYHLFAPAGRRARELDAAAVESLLPRVAGGAFPPTTIVTLLLLPVMLRPSSDVVTASTLLASVELPGRDMRAGSAENLERGARAGEQCLATQA